MMGQRQMQIRWGMFLIAPVIVSLLLFVIPQVAFLHGSFFGNLGYGQISTELTTQNYLEFFTDNFYLRSLLLTVGLSVLTVVFTVGLGLPAARAIIVGHGGHLSLSNTVQGGLVARIELPTTTTGT